MRVIPSPIARESSSGRSVRRAKCALGTISVWPGRIGNVSANLCQWHMDSEARNLPRNAITSSFS